MAWKVEKLYGPGQAAAEEAAAEAEKAAKHQAVLKSIADCACCDCGAFGPWGDGEFRYCAEHAPDELRFAARHFQKLKEAARA